MVSSPHDSEVSRKKCELTEYERESAWFQEAHEEGRNEGLQFARGMMREAVLHALASKNLAPTPEQRALLDGCSDPDQILLWLTRSEQAKSTEAVFATASCPGPAPL